MSNTVIILFQVLVDMVYVMSREFLIIKDCNVASGIDILCVSNVDKDNLCSYW